MEKKFSLEMGKFHQHGMLDPSNHQVTQKIDESNLTSSERLFFKLWSSKLLNDGHFTKDQVIIARGQKFTHAYIVISGNISQSDQMGSTEIGPGAVIGLAEGIADIPSSYDIVANNTVNTKLINIEKAVKEVTSLNSGLKGICRSTIMRILNLKVAPSHLK